MDLRKIQRTSGGTFFVCLPKDWAERNGLDRGTVVSVTETADGTLVINPKYNVERTPQVAVIVPSPLLDRVIIEKYLLGYDIIQVQAKDRISTLDRERVKQALLGPQMLDSGIFNSRSLQRIIDQHQSGRRDFSAAIWALLMFEQFQRKLYDR